MYFFVPKIQFAFLTNRCNSTILSTEMVFVHVAEQLVMVHLVEVGGTFVGGDGFNGGNLYSV